MSNGMCTDHDPGTSYVYALVDPVVFRTTGDEVKSIFYIGKGTRQRFADHEKGVLREIEELVAFDKVATKKARITRILERGDRVDVLCLSHGYGDRRDVERAESLAIETVGRMLAAEEMPPLTNARREVESGFRRLGKILPSGELDLPVEGAAEGGERVLLVKGTRVEMHVHDQRLLPSSALPGPLAAHASRINALETVGEEPIYTRRGWDPRDPWDDLAAAERGRRYWGIGKETVARWLRSPEECPTSLLLAIPDAGGRTVVRYAWSIDPEGTWEYFPDSSQWGVPLGERNFGHRVLNRSLHEVRDGKSVQVLKNHVAGWRVLEV